MNTKDPAALIELGIPPSVTHLKLWGISKPGIRRESSLQALIVAPKLETVVLPPGNVEWGDVVNELRAKRPEVQLFWEH